MLYQIKSQISSLCKQELPFVCPRKANLCGTRKEQKKEEFSEGSAVEMLHPPGFPVWIPTQETDEGCLELLDLQFCGLCLPPLLKHKASKGIYVHRSCSCTTSFQTSPPFSWQEYSCGLRSSSRIFPGRPSHPRQCRGSACAIGLSFCATPLCRGGVSVLGRAAPPSHRVPRRILPGLGSCRRMFSLGRGFCVFAVRKKTEERFLPFGNALAEF